MPISFRTTFTYRSYSIGPSSGPVHRTRSNRIRLTSRANEPPPPSPSPRYIRLGEIERKYRERCGEREGGGASPRAIIPKNGTNSLLLEFFPSLKFEGDSKQSFRVGRKPIFYTIFSRQPGEDENKYDIKEVFFSVRRISKQGNSRKNPPL